MDAIQLRTNIEKQAQKEHEAGGKYIRPIVLFQAQPNVSEDSETFDKIKNLLISMGIPKEQIANKTSKIDDIGKTDLMSESCKIRYIITVNALKEGWDCPFAYILASLANKTSRVDVEQILGRILWQPYTMRYKTPLLNTSYVLTSSNDFRSTLDGIVSALNKSGFSCKDYRVAEETSEQNLVQPDSEQLFFATEVPEIVEEPTGDDSFDDVNPEKIQQVISSGEEAEASVGETPVGNLAAMIEAATSQSENYNRQVEETTDFGFVGGELGDMLKQNVIQAQYRDEIKDLHIPQFYIKGEPDLFGNDLEILESEHLSEGFTLAGQDAQVSFELATGEMYSVYIQKEGEAVPKYKKASKAESEYIQQYLESLPQEKRIKQYTNMIAAQINKNNRYATSDIEDYVRSCVANMTQHELEAMETAVPTYA